jgi:hypothetical protein
MMKTKLIFSVISFLCFVVAEQTFAQDLPDLVITDIILKNRRSDSREIIVNTVVRNIGAVDAIDGFIVRCSYSCNGNPHNYFSGMQATNGLAAGKQMTLGDDSWLSLSGCSFVGDREFHCIVDADQHVSELDESNNTRSEVLLTGM